LLAVESCGPLARLLVREDAAAHILPVVQKFSVVRRGYSVLCYVGRAGRQAPLAQLHSGWRGCSLLF